MMGNDPPLECVVANANDPPGRLDRRKQKTRAAMIAAAMRLIHERGYDAVTMEQIAEAADVARGTLYNHFPVKEALVAAFLEQESLARNAERVVRMRALPDTRSRLATSLTELVEAVRAQPVIFEKYFTYRTQQMISLRRDTQETSGLRLLEDDIIRLGQERGELRRDLPVELIEALYEFTFIIVAQRFYQNPGAFDSTAAVTQCVEVFMHGAGAGPRHDAV
jgi:AcrR family transcriptional regulator